MRVDLNTFIEKNHLRILCRDAFGYFFNHLKEYPGNYLEIGVFEGYGLRELAKEYPKKTFYGIDPFIEDGYTTGHNGVPKGERTWEQMAATYRNILERGNIVFFEQTSRSWGEELTDEKVKEMNISAVLVDGDHSFEEALNDMKISVRCLHRGGVMWVDDQQLPSVGEAVREFAYQFPERIRNYRGSMIVIK